MKRMQSTPLIISRPNRKDSIAAVNLSPIFSTDTSSMMTTMHSGISALSTLYGEKIDNFTTNTEANEFSCWLGPKIASTANNKNQLDGTYIEKIPEQFENVKDASNKENTVSTESGTILRTNSGQVPILSDILNKPSETLLPKSPDKISITVNKQSSVWLNTSRDYAKEPSNETEDKDMEELHTELDKILDQLQKLVT